MQDKDANLGLAKVKTGITGSGDAASPGSVAVWDLPVRIFHWSLVISVLTAWLSAGWSSLVHETAGYVALALLLFRIWWGLAGTRHARFRDFVHSPFAVLRYLGDVARMRAPRYIGHNPAGGAMIVVILLLLAVIAVSGWLQLTREFFGVTWVEKIHHWSANALISLIPIHVLGALLSSMLHQENLIKAMFTGRKPAHNADDYASAIRTPQELLLDRIRASEAMALLSILVAAGVTIGVLTKEKLSDREKASTAAEAAINQPAIEARVASEAAPPSASSSPQPSDAALTPAPAKIVQVAGPPLPASPTINQLPGPDTPVPSTVPSNAIEGALQGHNSATTLRDLQDYIAGGPDDPSKTWMLASGGRLYDKWYAAMGKKGPTTNHPSWPEDNTNVKGADTWRCKSCHGWDYLGRDGQYRSGSNATGIRGVQRARNMLVESIVAILENKTHQFTDNLIPGHAKQRLALFISQGQHTVGPLFLPTGKPKGDVNNGRTMFQSVCAACHGFNGKARKLGLSADPAFTGDPMYVGTKANSGPVEVLHKIRNGHPGAVMVSLRALPMQSAVDLLAYAQTLPTR